MVDSLLLATLIAGAVMISIAIVSKYLAKKHAQPYIEQIEAIYDMDIPIGEKIKLMNEVNK